MKTLLFGLVLIAGASGCMHMEPTGPLAHIMGAPKSVPTDEDEKAAANMPPPRPVPPAMLVTPGEVTAESADDAVRKLTNELQTDGKSIPNVPFVSEYKGGVKIR